MQWCRRDKVALKTSCIKNVKLKIIKKDRLSVFRITGAHETFDYRPRVGHSWSMWSCNGVFSVLC